MIYDDEVSFFKYISQKVIENFNLLTSVGFLIVCQFTCILEDYLIYIIQKTSVAQWHGENNFENYNNLANVNRNECSNHWNK